jgi:putative ABC transport system permease protein
MLKNYFKTAFRFLVKNKSYSIINMLGLSVGMSCFILLTLFVQNEFSYDEYHAKKGQVHQVLLKDTTDNQSDYTTSTMAPMGPLFESAIPEVLTAVRFGSMDGQLVRMNNEKYILSKIHLADFDLFRTVDIPIVTGRIDYSGNNQDQIAISKSEAERIYGDSKSALEEFIDIDEVGLFQIAAVFEDIPDNSHMDIDYVIDFRKVDVAMKSLFTYSKNTTVMRWGFLSAFPLYVEIGDSEDLEAITKKMEMALAPHQANHIIKLLPINEIYFSPYNSSYFGKKGNKSDVQMYMIIAAIILIVAVINYMNMATARYTNRAKEVGIRKTIGGHRGQIARQFFIESYLMALICMLLALCLTELAMSAFNGFIDRSLNIDFSAIETYLVLIGFTFIIGTSAGIYPSIYLSAFKPIEILSGKVTKGPGGSIFRKVLVGFQFCICLGLIGVTAIVYQQFQHMQNLDLGFNKDQIIGVPLKDDKFKDQYQAFKTELLSNPSVTSVSGVAFSVFTGSSTFYLDIEGREEPELIGYMSVEPNFLEMLNIEVVDGVGFTPDVNGDFQRAEVINEAAVEKFGWEEPLGQKAMTKGVTGVVKDFVYGSAKESIKPLAIVPSKGGYTYVYVKLNGASVKNGLAHIASTFNTFSTEYPFDYEFLDDQFAKKYEQEARLSKVFSTFSVLAIFIAGLGIFGLSIFMAEQRVKEIGIRKVLGASMAHIMWILNSGITKLMLFIAIITLPILYYFMSQWLEGFAFRIDLSPFSMLLPLAILVGLVWSILIYQSIKSARANPVNALRTE